MHRYAKINYLVTKLLSEEISRMCDDACFDSLDFDPNYGSPERTKNMAVVLFSESEPNVFSPVFFNLKCDFYFVV